VRGSTGGTSGALYDILLTAAATSLAGSPGGGAVPTVQVTNFGSNIEMPHHFLNIDKQY